MKNSLKRISVGFTLIEIIVVVTVMAILSTIGLASFSEYNHSQTLGAVTLDVYTMLNTAKSRAQSQVKPSTCLAPNTLDGYKVSICGPLSSCTIGSTDDYQLQAVCSGVGTRIDGKNLPQNISFVSSQGKSFLFPVIKGGATVDLDGTPVLDCGGVHACDIVISGYGKTRSINIATESGKINTAL